MIREENFRQADAKSLSSEWKIKRLDDENLVELIMGQSPPSSTYNEDKNGLLFLQGKMEFGEIYPSPTVYCSEPVKVAEKNDILISVRAPVGEVNISLSKVCIGRGLAAIRCNSDRLSHSFLFYYLKHKSKRFEAISTGSTFKAIRKNDLESFELHLPPLPEQKKIAEILSTVDKAIEKVNEGIDKTQRLKKCLMQELLTGRRNTVDGREGRREFKQTEIGRIPKEWEVVRLGDESIAKIRGNKTINRFEKVTFIPMEFVPDSGVFAKYEIRPMKDVRSFTYCEPGDLLLAKITPSLENGKQGIVPKDVLNGFSLATTEVFPIACKNIDRLFLFYVLKFPKFRNKIIASMIGTTGRQRASKESVENLKLPLPPLPEQKKIAEILSKVDRRLGLMRKKREKLERVKRGLMNDLLSGQRRVRIK